MKKYATKGSHEGEQQQYTQYTFLLYSSRAHTFPDVYFYINNRCPSILQKASTNFSLTGGAKSFSREYWLKVVSVYKWHI